MGYINEATGNFGEYNVAATNTTDNVVEKITRSLNSFENPIAICQKKEYNVFV